MEPSARISSTSSAVFPDAAALLCAIKSASFIEKYTFTLLMLESVVSGDGSDGLIRFPTLFGILPMYPLTGALIYVKLALIFEDPNDDCACATCADAAL